MRLILFLLPVVLCAQLQVDVTTTHTQAVLRLTGWSGACTMDVHENNAAGLQHPDWPNIADSAHPLTTTNTKNEKFLVIGQRTGDKALAAAEQYYYSITGCGTATGSFVTKPPIIGAISHKQPAQNLANGHALDYPDVKLIPSHRNKWYIHPITGIRHRLISQPEDFSWMDSLNASFVYPSGGQAWTAFASIVNGATSTATTTNSNPVYLYANFVGHSSFDDPWQDNRTLENVGVVVWGQCLSGSGDDCDIEIMLQDNPAVLPKAGTTIQTVRLGAASFVQVTGTHPTTGTTSSTVSAAVLSGTAAYPGGAGGTTGFPRPGFQGWGDFTMTKDMALRSGGTTATVSGGNTLTIGTISVFNHFQRGMKPGQHIYVASAGSACSSWGINNICTVASVTDGGEVTLVETGLPAGSTAVAGMPWGLAIRKKTSVGQVRIGAMYRGSGHFGILTGTSQSRCHPVAATRSDGVKGRLCLVPKGGAAYLYFIGEDGEVVVPIDGLHRFGGALQSVDFHSTDADTIYVWHVNTGVYKYKYTGDYGVTPTVWERDPLPGQTGGARYALNSPGTYAEATWTNPFFTITQVLSTTSITSQITDAYPAQVSPPYPAWSAPNFSGVTGGMIVLYRLFASADNSPCQVAVFNAESGLLVDFINTAEAPGSPHTFGTECHTVQLTDAVANTWKVGYNIPPQKGTVSTAKLLHGPHRIQIEAVMRGGVWSNNTCLEWPMGSAGFCTGLGTTLAHYDKTCPTDIPEEYKPPGAQADNCVTLRVTGSTPAKAACSEKGNDPSEPDDVDIYGLCEWNADPEYSGGPALAAGMKFLDRSQVTGSRGDNENFRILKVFPTGDGTTVTVVAQRQASREHCCAPDVQNPLPTAGVCLVGDPLRSSHADNWFGQPVPGGYGSCNSMAIFTTYPDPTTSTGKYYTEVPHNLGEGHSTMGRTVGQQLRFVSGVSGEDGSARNLTNFSDLGTQPPPPTNYILKTKFQGLVSPVGTDLQQYLSQSQMDQSDLTNKYWTGDANFLAGGGGGEQNAFTGGIEDGRPIFIKVAGFSSLWRVTVYGGGGAAAGLSTLKVKPVVGWCGPKGLSDISSPALGAQIDTAPEYSYCVAYKDGQCRSGSAAGQAWVKCPHAYKHPTASTADDLHTGIEFSGDPSLASLAGPAGFSRRFRSDGPDETGGNGYLVTDAFRPAGGHFAYWNAPMSPSGKLALPTSGGSLNLVSQVAWLAKVPKMPITHIRSSGYRQMTMKVGPRTGMTHARVRFGNNPSFHCNSHYRTPCVTDSALTPYAFIQTDGATADQSPLTPTTCGAGGCTLTMQVWPDEVLWYQLETSTNGTTFTADPVQVVAP